MKKTLLILLTIFLAFLLTGCWGQRDIEDRGFVIGTAIDLAEGTDRGEPMLKMTNQTVAPTLLGTPGPESSANVATRNVSSTGSSLLTISDDIDAKSERIPFYEHLKLIVVSEEAVSIPHYLPKVIDFFVREAQMRREIRLVISEDEASRVLEVEPEGERLPVIYIDSIFENTEEHTLQVFRVPRIGDLHELLLTKFSYVIPKIKKIGDEVQVSEAYAISGETDSVAGSLNQEEVMGLNLITGKQKIGVIEFTIDDELMNFQMTDLSRRIRINVDDLENIEINIEIELVGFIDEMYGARSLTDLNILDEIEEALVKRTEELVKKAINRGQDQLELDIFQFNKHLYGRHYDQWQKLKDDWDQGENYFANNTTVTVSSEVVVESIGATDKVKR